MEKTGIAGCGRMGQPMLQTLLDAGFDAQGFDVKPRETYGAFSRHMADSPAEFAQGLTTLFTVVRDIEQTEEVLFSDQALVRSAPELSCIIISSTLSPKYVRALRERIPDRIALVDAPMSGAAIAAREKRLSFMLGGDVSDIASIQPQLDAMGAHFHHMGGFGTGMAAKVLNNLVAASSTAATRLALEWADTLGIDEQRLLALMHTSSGQTWFGSNFDDIEFARDGFDGDNTIGILKKDVESAMDGAPEGADMTLHDALVYAIERLKPR